VTFDLNGQAVWRQGALTVRPTANTIYSLHLRWQGRAQGTLGAVTVAVDVPSEVTISRNDQAPLLRQALATPGTTIRVLGGVQLDLSLGSYRELPVAQGVTLVGTRTARDPGPRLYTRVRHPRLLVVRGNDVRITGLRIEGPDLDISDADDRATGIFISPAAGVTIDHVEIDHNELSGWNGAAVGVDDDAGRLDYVGNPEAVGIHDNFIHHNQHANSAGYGVVIGDGAYALIERNVFDYNRHAIAGDGSDGSGYRAFRNLVLQHGGRHRTLGFWGHTHQFDMHGQDSCGIGSVFNDALYNCGTAGHDVWIEHNAFLYSEGPAVKIRGTPQRRPWGAFVISNVFAHDHLSDAVEQTEDGVYRSANRLGIDGSERLGTCDFDGDRIADRFMATGETWWYASRGTGPWVYLNSSRTLLPQLRLGLFDGDSRCDVVAGGLISSGGTEPWRPL
jgi:hypothetical protein